MIYHQNCKICKRQEIFNKFVFLPLFILLMVMFVNVVTPLQQRVEYDFKWEKSINPELKQGLGKITYYDAYFRINPLDQNDLFVGTYSEYTHNIQLSLKSKNMKKTLCHELMHHKWFTLMTQEERDVWIEEFNSLEDKRFYKNVEEYYAYINEKNYGECYNEKRN